MKPHEIDQRILRRLLLDDDLTQSQLACALGVKRTDIHRSVSRLVNSGLVRLERSGVEMLPRLTIFDKITELETGISALREAVA